MLKKTTLPKSFIKQILLGGVLLYFAVFASQIIKSKTGEQELKQIEQAIKNAAVQCYALEGAYPPSYAYLEENYNVSVNTEKYMVDYKCFASNIAPSITVLPKNMNFGDVNT